MWHMRPKKRDTGKQPFKTSQTGNAKPATKRSSTRSIDHRWRNQTQHLGLTLEIQIKVTFFSTHTFCKFADCDSLTKLNWKPQRLNLHDLFGVTGGLDLIVSVLWLHPRMWCWVRRNQTFFGCTMVAPTTAQGSYLKYSYESLTLAFISAWAQLLLRWNYFHLKIKRL